MNEIIYKLIEVALGIIAGAVIATILIEIKNIKK